MSETICPDCGEPWVCPHCGEQMVHHDLFGIAWCPEVYWHAPKTPIQRTETPDP